MNTQTEDTYMPPTSTGDPTSISGAMSSTTVMDPEGDVILVISSDKGKVRFLVNSSVLCLASPVFRALLGRHSRLKEAVDLATTLASNTPANDSCSQVSTPYELKLEDDNPKALAVMLRIIHLKNDLVPESLDENQLHDIGIICDKYDLRQALVIWADKWISSLVSNHHELKQLPPTVFGLKWLFIAYAFGKENLFCLLSREIILSSRIDESGGLVMTTEDEWSSQYIPDFIFSKIATYRQQCLDSLMDYVHQVVDKYSGGHGRQCRNKMRKTAACDMLILGFFIATFKQKHIYPAASSNVMHESIRVVKDILTLKDYSFPVSLYYNVVLEDEWNHRHSCSPLADFNKTINVLCEAVVGLNLADLPRANQNAEQKVPVQGQSLWDYIQYEASQETFTEGHHPSG